ncbi:FecR family protein [Mangrovibacterium diazotrophicum]|uniref:FecR family protein n=1 Tax=Mangrovibacterium diazotrophicum TaxID=1261403 RepID=A0A419WB99_9BACT|nr:FecR domain-containing protein [Mangrovibacterium diazotrophicum]RKD92745.1 FecR family protein [Mangrovibacterium diazotrophicum]
MDELILKCLQGEASKDEVSQVEAWIDTDPENFKHYEEIRDAWFAAGQLADSKHLNIEQRYSALQNRIQNSPAQKSKTIPIKRIPEWIKIAAVFVLAFLLGAVWMSNRGQLGFQSEVAHYEIEAPYGAKLNMNLGDGTKVWLNAGSKLTYSSTFNSKDRDIQLTGEGYFEVAKNTDLPFVVKAGDVKVKAVGTAFNVKAYADENLLETTLVEGKVDVSEFGDHVVLQPNQKITINLGSSLNNNMSYKIADNVNTELYTSWRGKRWIFERENMLDFAKTLERRYDVKITIADERLKSYKISGSIEQQTLGQLLQAVQLTIPLNYTINENKVILTINEKLKREYEPLIKK